MSSPNSWPRHAHVYPGRYTDQVGARMHAVAAEFARIAGAVAFEACDIGVSQRFYLAGLRAAHTSGDGRSALVGAKA